MFIASKILLLKDLLLNFTSFGVKCHMAAKKLERFRSHYENSLFKYTENFTTKNENFQIKHSDILRISAQNIDCGDSLEPASARRF